MNPVLFCLSLCLCPALYPPLNVCEALASDRGNSGKQPVLAVIICLGVIIEKRWVSVIKINMHMVTQRLSSRVMILTRSLEPLPSVFSLSPHAVGDSDTLRHSQQVYYWTYCPTAEGNLFTLFLFETHRFWGKIENFSYHSWDFLFFCPACPAAGECSALGTRKLSWINGRETL